MKPKTEISWHRRRNEIRAKNDLPSEKKSWRNTAVTRVQALGAALVALLAWILLNGVTALQNAEQLPDAFVKTRDSILTRYYDDSSWTGVWSSNPEGYVDSEDFILSNIDVHVQLQTGQGKVDGMIATHKLCTKLPFAMDGVLFRGEVSGDKVQGVAYDYIGGKEIQLALITIERDSHNPSILTVHAADDVLESIPLEARIRRDFNKKAMDTQTNGGNYCEPLRYPNGRTHSKKRKPIAELQWPSPPAN